MTKEAAIELAKATAKRDRRIMAVRSQYGDYTPWYHYTPNQERLMADAGAEAGGVISCYVYPDGTVKEPKDLQGPP